MVGSSGCFYQLSNSWLTRTQNRCNHLLVTIPSIFLEPSPPAAIGAQSRPAGGRGALRILTPLGNWLVRVVLFLGPALWVSL